ncbi:MAG: hypothetical protein ACYSVY_18655, partial [Planctomycetota bacterium]
GRSGWGPEIVTGPRTGVQTKYGTIGRQKKTADPCKIFAARRNYVPGREQGDERERTRRGLWRMREEEQSDET